MFCSQCGKQIEDNSAFCLYCGAPQQMQQQQPMVQQSYIQQPTVKPSPKAAGKGLKIAFFCVLGAAVIAFGVFAYFQWIIPNDKQELEVMKELPSTDMDALSEWNNDEFSLDKVGDAESGENPQTVQLQHDAQRVIGAWESAIDDMYLGFEFSSDGTLRYYEDSDEYVSEYAIVENGMMITEDGETFGPFEYRFTNTDSGEVLVLIVDGETIELERVVSISPPAEPTPVPTPQQTPQPTEASAGLNPDVLFANGFVMDIETYLSETWWASNGNWVHNPNAAALAPGYPKTYEIKQGELQYIFDTSAMTVQMLMQDDDGTVTDKGIFDYEVDPHGFYIHAFYRVQEIDGIEHNLYSKFFVCDDVLFEVEMMDDSEVSNYIAYSIYGP